MNLELKAVSLKRDPVIFFNSQLYFGQPLLVANFKNLNQSHVSVIKSKCLFVQKLIYV